MSTFHSLSVIQFAVDEIAFNTVLTLNSFKDFYLIIRKRKSIVVEF